MYWNLCLPQNFICPIVVPIVVSPSSITPDPKLSQPAKVSEHECIPEENSNQNSYLDLNQEDLKKAGYQTKKKAWSQQEDKKLIRYYEKQNLDWPEIAALIPGRNAKMCYSRYRRLQTQTKLTWKKADDVKLLKLIEERGENWRQISQHFQKRTHKQVREHYMNYLRPEIRKEEWTLEEDLLLVDLLNTNGKHWKFIEEHFPGRTQNQIKNRYFGRLKKLAQKKGSSENNLNNVVEKERKGE